MRLKTLTVEGASVYRYASSTLMGLTTEVWLQNYSFKSLKDKEKGQLIRFNS
jgi:hypothetical protein